MRKRTIDLNCENDFFSARHDGATVVFTPKGNQMLMSTTIKAKEAVLSYIKRVERHPEARILLIMPQLRKVGREDYLSFFEMVGSSRISKNGVMRLFRAIDQGILHIMASDLFTISVDHGEVLPLFAAISMACDYRIMGDDAVFHNPALELGLIPKGGIAWFLTRQFGRAQALELILADKAITAREAEQMGLINRCVPVESLEREALAVARRFESFPETTLKMAKRLVNNTTAALPEFLEFENQELFMAMVRQKQLTSV